MARLSSPKAPLIAVITRTKNRELLLKRALQSVKLQSTDNYVHVIINDGGDPTKVDALVKEYGSQSVKVLHNKESVGLTRALNQAIQSVDSKYIAILDDDDSWHKDFIKETTGFLEEHNAPGVMVLIDRIVEEIEGGEVVFRSKNRWLPGVTEISLYKQCLDQYLATVGFVYRRSIYEELEGYDETLGVAEDWDFGIRFLMKHDVLLLQTKDALAYYHHRPESKGAIGNSVFDRVAEHKHNLNLLANRYLRRDIEEGRYGIGVIMNELMYRREREEVMESKSTERVVRIEGHVNFAMKDGVAEVVREINEHEKRILPILRRATPAYYIGLIKRRLLNRR